MALIDHPLIFAKPEESLLPPQRDHMLLAQDAHLVGHHRPDSRGQAGRKLQGVTRGVGGPVHLRLESVRCCDAQARPWNEGRAEGFTWAPTFPIDALATMLVRVADLESIVSRKAPFLSNHLGTNPDASMNEALVNAREKNKPLNEERGEGGERLTHGYEVRQQQASRRFRDAANAFLLLIRGCSESPGCR